MAAQAATTQPIVVLVSNISSVQSGGVATLSWSVTGAASCIATGGWSGSKTFFGTFITQPLVATKTYTLSCTGAGGTTARSVTINVVAPVISATAPVKIAVLGASTAAGKNLVEGGYSLSDSWVNRYLSYLSTNRPGSTVTNLAVSGYNSYQVLPTGTINPSNRSVVNTAHNITKAISYKPDAIIVNFPSDANKLNSTSEAMANFSTLDAAAKAVGVTMFFTTPQPIVTGANAADLTLRLAMRKLMLQTFGSRAIDFWPLMVDQNNKALPGLITTYDGVHATAEGHRIMFEAIKATDIPNNLAKQTLPPPVPLAAPTLTLTTSTTSAASGVSATLNWTSSKATTCTASGAWTGSQAVTGSKVLTNLVSTGTYTLTCTGSGGSIIKNVQINVASVPTPAPLPTPVPSPTPTTGLPALTFTTSPNTISVGGSTTLTWQGTNVTSCIATGSWWSKIGTSGAKTITAIPENKIYKLACTGPKGTVTANAAVTVSNGAVQGVSTYNFATTLAQGDSGEAVIELQKFLTVKGYLSAESSTGYFGPLTKEAVVAFQQENGLQGVGVVGPRTRELLNSHNRSSVASN